MELTVAKESNKLSGGFLFVLIIKDIVIPTPYFPAPSYICTGTEPRVLCTIGKGSTTCRPPTPSYDYVALSDLELVEIHSTSAFQVLG